MHGTLKIAYQVYHSKQDGKKRKSTFLSATILCTWKDVSVLGGQQKNKNRKKTRRNGSFFQILAKIPSQCKLMLSWSVAAHLTCSSSASSCPSFMTSLCRYLLSCPSFYPLQLKVSSAPELLLTPPARGSKYHWREYHWRDMLHHRICADCV